MTQFARLPIVVAGVTGCGKSTVGLALAQALELPFIDGDDLHSEHCVNKMRGGQPLTDADRAPWLDTVTDTLANVYRHPGGVVIACSALKLPYRERLRRGTNGLRFFFLEVSRAVVAQRLRARDSHFMPESLLESQFEALERPGDGERDVWVVSADMPIGEIVSGAVKTLRGVVKVLPSRGSVRFR